MSSHRVLFFVIILAVCLTQFASDVYAPAMPSIAEDLQAEVNWVQWSMAIYMLGVAVTQLIYGPLSEGIGRRGPLLIGLLIMLLGSSLCFIASDVNRLIWGRLVQGIGAGACAALWRAILRDVFSGEELSQYGSYLVIFVMFIIPAAPGLGSYLEDAYGWRSIFAFMLVYTVVALLAVLFGFKETSQHHHRDRLRFSFVAKTYWHLLSNPIFMGMTLCTLISYGSFFAWFVAGPVLLIQGAGITSGDFGWISFLGGGGAYGLSAWINSKAVERIGMAAMMRIGWAVMHLAGLWMLGAYFYLGTTGWAIVPPVLLFYVGATFIWPNAFATAFGPFGKIAGYVGALYGFMQIFGAALIGGVVSYLSEETQLPLSYIMIGAPLISWILYEKVVRVALRNS